MIFPQRLFQLESHCRPKQILNILAVGCLIKRLAAFLGTAG